MKTPMPDGRGRGRQSQARAARLKALELRMAGFTFAQIGEQLGRSESWAHKAFWQALNETEQEDAATARKLELARLDKLQQRVYVQAVQGDLRALDRQLKIMERRAKYLGLDNPRLSTAVEHGADLLQSLAVQLQAIPDTYVPVDQQEVPDAM